MERDPLIRTYVQQLVQRRTGRDLEDHLRELYIERRYTDPEIARLLGVSRFTVFRWRRDFGIGREARTTALS